LYDTKNRKLQAFFNPFGENVVDQQRIGHDESIPQWSLYQIHNVAGNKRKFLNELNLDGKKSEVM
jgi:hypothetical protein